MELKQIGVIHSSYKAAGDAPFQGRLAEKTAVLEVFPAFEGGLRDIEQASHLIVLYWGHLANRDRLQVQTPHSPEIKGVFACRSPDRPKPIAFCVAVLLQKNGRQLLVRGVDAVDGSPLLDLKPYFSHLDSVSGV